MDRVLDQYTQGPMLSPLPRSLSFPFSPSFPPSLPPDSYAVAQTTGAESFLNSSLMGFVCRVKLETVLKRPPLFLSFFLF